MKFVVLLAAMLSMSSVFAQKNNITFDVGDIVRQEGNFNTNLVMSNSKGHADDENNNKAFLFNYSREMITQLQVRFILGYSFSEKLAVADVAADEWVETTMLTYGLGLTYNFNPDLRNSWFAGATWINQSVDFKDETVGAEESGNVSTILIEVGKRFKLGELAGMTFTWSPSLSYSMTTYAEEIAGAFGGEDKVNDLRINLLRTDLFF